MAAGRTNAGQKNGKKKKQEREIMSERMVGVVKWFNNSKGYGFIQQDKGDDIFVHFRQIRGDGYRTLQEGQQVEFVMVEGQKGLQAEDVAAVAE